MTDINDWPEACIYNLKDKVVIVNLAELKSNATTYNSRMKPWYLDFWRAGNALRKYRYKVKQPNYELYIKQTLTGENEYNCCRPYPINKGRYRGLNTHWVDDCKVHLQETPASHDWIISILYNSNSYKIKAEDQQNDKVTRTVFVTRLPLYVYYTTDETIRAELKTRLYLKITKVTNYHAAAADAAFFDPSGFEASHTYEPTG